MIPIYKIIASTFFIITIIFCQPYPNITYGDLNQNNEVNVIDILILVDIILIETIPTEYQLDLL